MTRGDSPNADAVKSPLLPTLSIREQRRWVIAGEIGWNSLPGFGPTLTYNIVPELSLDTGFGVSMVGPKVGLRVRGNLLRSNWTPTFGAAILYGAGTSHQDVDATVRGENVTYRLYRSPFAQFTAGASYTGSDGFAFLAIVGYAILLRENAVFVDGSRDAFDTIRNLAGSGVVVAASFGYAF